jgi:hypothetical protein
VPHTLNGEHTDLGGDHCRKLSWVLKHFVVARDKAGEAELVQSDNESTVVELWQPLIDSPQRDQIDLGDEVAKAVEDRLGEVVVERNVHSGRRL